MDQTIQELLINKAVAAVDRIENPYEQVTAISRLLTSIGQTMPVKTCDELTAADKPKAKASRKAKKEEPETVAEAAAEPVAEPVIQAETAEEKPVEPSAEEVAEIQAEIDKLPELTLPKDDDTKEINKARHMALISRYGNMPLSKVFNDPEINKYLTHELDSMNALMQEIMQVFGVSIDENGNEVNATSATMADIDGLIKHYIHEVDRSVKAYQDVTLDKFLTKFIPYMVVLYKIYSYPGEKIMMAGTELINGKPGFKPQSINIKNAKPLLTIIEDLAA